MKIIWSFDPFEKNHQMQKMGNEILTKYFNRDDEIEAVYVASNAEVKLAVAYDVPLDERYSVYPKKLMANLLNKMDRHDIGIEVLVEMKISLTASVKRFVSYADDQKTDLILIASHVKNLSDRIVLGSFAASMIHLSHTDLLIFHPSANREIELPKKILFGFDFSAKGYEGLRHVIAYAKRWNATLVVVHVPMVEYGMKALDLSIHLETCKAELETFLQKENINFVVRIDQEIIPVEEKILDVAEEMNVDILSIAAQANKLETFLGGSTTRHLLRESTLPTLVIKV